MSTTHCGETLRKQIEAAGERISNARKLFARARGFQMRRKATQNLCAASTHALAGSSLTVLIQSFCSGESVIAGSPSLNVLLMRTPDWTYSMVNPAVSTVNVRL